MIAASCKLTLKLQGPVLTHSTTQGRFGLDAVMARSGNRFYLPGTLVKGLIGEAWQELGCVDAAYVKMRGAWFGDQSRVQNLPNRGSLYFEDLLDLSTKADDSTATQYRIQIDEERGSVKQGAYLVMEAPYRPGQEVAFEGTLWMLAKDRDAAERARRNIQTALHWISSAGAERSVGFGRVLGGECGPLQVLEWKAAGQSAAVDVFNLELRFTRPVCFAKRRVAENLFDSEDWVTGGALKGSLATMLAMDQKRWPHLREHLHAIRFTHAFPSKPAEEPQTLRRRPQALPQSLVCAKKKFYDLVLLDEAKLIEGEAPAFQIDWKDGGTIRAEFGWPELETELRVRTAIEGETKRAQDKQLFAYKMIVPGADDVWLSSVVVDGVVESARGAVAAELDEALECGLFALGKTKARAEVSKKAGALQTAKLHGNTVAITLQTSALLCDPRRHLAPNGQTGTAKMEAMQAEYREVWQDLSGGALTLLHYFHTISLAGSEYMRKRFQDGQPYRPYLLTDPGSVFLLRIEDFEKAESCVTQWLNRGIGLSAAVLDFYGIGNVPKESLWKQCPFLPENGYGEIAVNVHETPRKGVEVKRV